MRIGRRKRSPFWAAALLLVLALLAEILWTDPYAKSTLAMAKLYWSLSVSNIKGTEPYAKSTLAMAKRYWSEAGSYIKEKVSNPISTAPFNAVSQPGPLSNVKSRGPIAGRRTRSSLSDRGNGPPTMSAPAAAGNIGLSAGNKNADSEGLSASVPENVPIAPVSKANYSTGNGKVAVKEKESSWFNADMLGTLPTLLIIETRPLGGEIYIDGQLYGLSRVEANLPPGLHKWKVLLPPAYAPVESQMNLRAGEVSTRTVLWSSGSVPRIEGGS